MKLDELAGDLRRPYDKERGYGVVKLQDANEEYDGPQDLDQKIL